MNSQSSDMRKAPGHLDVEHESLLSAFYSALESGAHRPALRYFDETITWQQLDSASDSLAGLLIARGFVAGDRLAICLQNHPAFVIGLLAVWKARGVAALISPINKTREFGTAVAGLEPSALLCLDDVYEDVAREVLSHGTTAVRTVVTVSALDFQSRDDSRLFAQSVRRQPGDTIDLMRLISDSAGKARQLERPECTAKQVMLKPVGPAATDIAVIAPTSGATGPPKGAMLTHRNLLFTAQTYRDWTGLQADEPVLAMAPVFHITGLVAGVLLGIVSQSPVVLTHRFHPLVTADAIRQWQPAFANAAITAYKALAAEPSVGKSDVSSLRICYSGGLPIRPAEVDFLEDRLGVYIHNAYGQTETGSPTHLVPFGSRAPVDEETGTLSVGIPVYDTTVTVVDDDGRAVASGEFGEFVTSGPQVMSGYWHESGAAAKTWGPNRFDGAPSGNSGPATRKFHTGDIGFVRADGWYFVVDRASDVINAAGYKIWPHEVEQVLIEHPAVREAVVVDIADEYRGQSTRAYVALHDGTTATAEELIEYSRKRLAAYKYPREIDIVQSLPRTATGKVLRRLLRD